MSVDLDALARLLDDAGLPWSHNGNGVITQEGLGSVGLVVYTQHGENPDATNRYAELVVGAVNALPKLLQLAHAAWQWRMLTDEDDPYIEPPHYVADLIAALRALGGVQ